SRFDTRYRVGVINRRPGSPLRGHAVRKTAAERLAYRSRLEWRVVPDFGRILSRFAQRARNRLARDNTRCLDATSFPEGRVSPLGAPLSFCVSPRGLGCLV